MGSGRRSAPQATESSLIRGQQLAPIHSPDRHTGAASGVLFTVQRVGGALGVALLEIPFFYSLERTRNAGASLMQSYAAAFASLMEWLLFVMLIITMLAFCFRLSRSSA
jgi:hypothetical protein